MLHKEFHTQRFADELFFLYFFQDEYYGRFFFPFMAEVVKMHLLDSLVLSVRLCLRNSRNVGWSVLEFDTGELFQTCLNV